MARLEDIAAHGKDKVVTPLDGDPRLVRCMFKNRADKNIEKLARGTHLLQKIANIMFPELMPKVVAFGQDPATNDYFMDVERAELDALHLHTYETPFQHKRPDATEHNTHELEYYKKRYGRTSHRRDRLLERVEQAGFPVEFYERNWSLAGGKTKYLDMEAPWSSKNKGMVRRYDPVALEKSISMIADLAKHNAAQTLLKELLELESGIHIEKA